MKRWGRWQLDVEAKTLVRPPYTIKLTDCRVPKRQIETLFEMSDAQGIDADDLGNLVLAFRDVSGRGVPDDWEEPVMSVDAAVARLTRR